MRLAWKVTAAAGLLAGGVALLWRAPRLPQIPQHPPAASPAEAEARLAALDGRDGGPLLDLCRPRLWRGQGQSVVVLLHGYTNCPHQFHQLGGLLRAQGHTVLAARLPYHGFIDRKAYGLSRMTSALLADYLGELLAIAHGLGESMTVLGFSFGGVLAGWIAQQRADVDHVVLVSPSLGLQGVRRGLRRPFARLRPLLPDTWRWWDPVLRERREFPPHGYLGFTLHGVATILRLGEGVLAAARHEPPQAKRLTMVINENDRVIDNAAARRLVAQWRQRGTEVDLVTLPADQGLVHDFMEPTRPEQQVAKVYPQVMTWLAPTRADG